MIFFNSFQNALNQASRIVASQIPKTALKLTGAGSTMEASAPGASNSTVASAAQCLTK
jgi:hypothetical protein